MRRPTIIALVVLGLLAAGGLGFALFERSERSGLAARSAEACNGQDVPSAGAPTQLPLGLPMTTGARVLRVDEQGRTLVAFATVPGSRDTIVQVRDQVLNDLGGAGYTVVDTDQEPGYEAEAELTGSNEGTLKVSPLCEGLLEVRYKIDR